MATYLIKLFGGLAVTWEGSRIDQFPTRRSAAILARLALSRQSAIGRDELAEALWPEEYLDVSRTRLRQELKRLRAALGPARDLVVTDKTWARLDLSDAEVDTHQFARHVGLSRTEEPRSWLEKAVSLHQGPLLPEFNEDWAFSPRIEFQAQFEDAVLNLARIQANADDHAAAIETAHIGLRLNPLLEPLVLLLMQSSEASGHPDRAMHAFSEYEKAKCVAGDFRVGHDLVEAARALRKPTAAPKSPPEIQTSSSPAFFDRYIGRESERELLRELLGPASGVRIVTLLGPGGAGKTRLAVEIAGQAPFLSLETVPADGFADRLEETLARGQMDLVVIDNAEIAASEVADGVKAALRANPSLKLLVTSRRKLDLPGERIVALSALAPMDEIADFGAAIAHPCIRLLIERLQTSGADFTMDATNWRQIVDLLRKLDGLPLAIELAAAGVAELGLAPFIQGFDNRFDLLVSARTDIPDRQRSLWAAIDSSYQALTSAQQEVLCGLSVFKGGCTPEMVARILDRDDAAECLRALRDRSLIQSYHGSCGLRYRILDSIRAFGEQQMGPDAHREIETRFATRIWEFTDIASTDAVAFREPAFLARLDAERENILRALELLVDHDLERAGELIRETFWFWSNSGFVRDARRIAGHIIDRLSHNHPKLGSLLFICGHLAFVHGEPEAGWQFFQRARVTYAANGDLDKIPWCDVNECEVAYYLGNFETARDIALAGQTSMPREHLFALAFVTAILGNARIVLGEVEAGLEDAEAGLALHLATGQEQEINNGYFDMGVALAEAGELPRARSSLQACLDGYARGFHHLTVEIWACELAAEIALELGEFTEAEARLTQARAIHERIGSPRDQAILEQLETWLAIASGRNPIDAVRRSLQRAVDLNQKPLTIDAIILAARFIAATGRPDSARELGAALLASCHSTGVHIRPTRRRWLAALIGNPELGEAVPLNQLAARAAATI